MVRIQRSRCSAGLGWRLGAVGLCLLGAWLGQGQTRGADESTMPAALVRAEEALQAAQESLAAGRSRDAGERLAEAGQALGEAADLGREVEATAIRQLAETCQKLARTLAFDAVTVEGLPTAQDLLRRRAESIRRQPARGGPPAMVIVPQPAGPSFARQIAPLLVGACGRCHVQGNRGDFSMQSFAVLAASGTVVPGDGPNSRLVEVIRTGDMPRGGGQVSPADFEMLVSWINAGAIFDGADPSVSLDRVQPAAAMAAEGPSDPPAASASPIGPDEVPFSTAVAGLLVENCQRCHGGGNPSAGFSVATFNDLAESGVIEPGRGAESLLVRKLVGVDIDGQRMPRGRPPLDDDTIAIIRKWIDEGAKLDMLEGTAELSRIASEGRSQTLSHEDLRTLRFAEAPQLWRRGIVDEEAAVEIRGDLCVVGNLDGARLASAADAAAEVEEKLRRELRLDGPLAKGGAAVLVFARGFDFSNFWQNVLGRERPRGLMGYADVSGDVVYAAVAVDGDVDNQRLMLAAELTAATLRAHGAPSWFAEAAGRILARKIAPEASAIEIWNDAEVVAKNSPPAEVSRFVTGPLTAEQVAITSAMLGAIDRDGNRLVGLLSRLENGDDFEAAFRRTYRMPPEQMLQGWGAGGR
jgi:hypothetical protein